MTITYLFDLTILLCVVMSEGTVGGNDALALLPFPEKIIMIVNVRRGLSHDNLQSVISRVLSSASR